MAEWFEEMMIQYAARLAYFVATNEEVAEHIRKGPRTAVAFAGMALQTEADRDRKANESFWDKLEVQ